MNLRVRNIETDSHDTKTLYLEDIEEGGCSFDYFPGQYLTFRFDELGARPIVRSYTMSSSPCETSSVAITVKREPEGHVSQHLTDTVKVGDVLRARGPMGKFIYDVNKDKSHLIMLAGGIGVTPFISILRQYLERPDTYPGLSHLSLFVSYKTRKDALFCELLERANTVESLSVVQTLTREEPVVGNFEAGRIDAGFLERFVSDFEQATFMTCGPQPMIDDVMAYLDKQGVAPEHNRTESFD